MACQKIILHLTVGAGSGGKRITKWQKIIFWAAGLRTTWETCKETKKTRVSYVNHRWEPTSKKKIRVRVPQASAMEKNIAPKNGHDVSIRVGWTPLALLRGSCAKFRHPRREKTKVAQVASSARSMQSSTFFGYFGLECVRLWTMGNFSLEFYLHLNLLWGKFWQILQHHGAYGFVSHIGWYKKLVRLYSFWCQQHVIKYPLAII